MAKKIKGKGIIMAKALAIAPISTPMLIVLAIIKRITQKYKSLLEKCWRITPANPRPVTIPIRAQTSCTETIKGKVNNGVQSCEKPNLAPLAE